MSDAPTTSIVVDYYDSSTTVTIDTTLTWWDIKAEIWGNLWQTSNSTNFNSSILDRNMNALMSDIYRWSVINTLNGKIYQAGDLDFLKWDTNFRIITNRALTADVNVWDIIIQVNTIDMVSAWTILLWWDIITYTSKTDTQLEWVTWITIKHLETEVFALLYQMPTNFDKPNNVGSWSSEIEYSAEWNLSIFYQIYKSGTDSFLYINWLSKDDIINVNYNNAYTNITDDSTIFPIPNSYGLSVVSNIISGNLWYKKWIPNSEQQMNIGYNSLQTMFNYYTSAINNPVRSIRAKPLNSKIRI